MQSEWKISKIGQQFKLTCGDVSKKLKNAEQVVQFCQKLPELPEGMKYLPPIYQHLIIDHHESKKISASRRKG